MVSASEDDKNEECEASIMEEEATEISNER